MRLDRYRHARDFMADAQTWLAEREAEHNLILGIAGGIAGDPGDDGSAYFAVARAGEQPVAVAMRTPPWNLLLSEVDAPAALSVIADDLDGTELPGVTGPPDAVRRFAELWSARHGGGHEVVMQERIYRISRVVPPPRVDGQARRAGMQEHPLLTEWVVAFHDEALPEEGGERARRLMAEWDPDTGRQFWLWEVGGRPASLVGAGSPTPTGIRIGPVYTPPEYRGRGYASALTAAVSQRMLDSGRAFCFLYTNLANPTANHIYQAIGYEPVTDALMVRFAR